MLSEASISLYFECPKKGAEKGQIIVTMRYDLLLLPLLNSYITSMSVIVCYNSLQSVN